MAQRTKNRFWAATNVLVFLWALFMTFGPLFPQVSPQENKANIDNLDARIDRIEDVPERVAKLEAQNVAAMQRMDKLEDIVSDSAWWSRADGATGGMTLIGLIIIGFRSGALKFNLAGK